jgi:hypothetical protein
MNPPGVEREERRLDREGDEEAEEQPAAGVGGHVDLGELLPVEGLPGRDVVAADDPEADHRGEHEQPADQRVEEELDRRVLPAGAAVRADDEVHRHEHDLEEHVEQEHVGGGEDADHRALEGEQQGEVDGHGPLGTLGVVPRRQDHQRYEHRDEHEHHQRDAVRGEGEPHAPGRDPRIGLAELEAVTLRLERDPHDDAQHQHQQRPAQGDLLGQVTTAARHEAHDQRAHQRQQRQDGQKREFGHQLALPPLYPSVPTGRLMTAIRAERPGTRRPPAPRR